MSGATGSAVSTADASPTLAGTSRGRSGSTAGRGSGITNGSSDQPRATMAATIMTLPPSDVRLRPLARTRMRAGKVASRCSRAGQRMRPGGPAAAAAP